MVKTNRIMWNFKILLEFHFKSKIIFLTRLMFRCFAYRTAFAANRCIGIYSRNIWRILKDSGLLLNDDIISDRGPAPRRLAVMWSSTFKSCWFRFKMQKKSRSGFEFQSVCNHNLAKVKDAKKSRFGTEVATRWSCCSVFLQLRQIRAGRGRPPHPPTHSTGNGEFPPIKSSINLEHRELIESRRGWGVSLRRSGRHQRDVTRRHICNYRG